MSDPKKTLRALGLSDAEIACYLALVAQGAQTASELTRRAHGKRPTTYYALRQLVDRGLVHKVGAAGAERFQAEPVEKLLTLLALHRQGIDALEADVRTLLPSLVPERARADGKPSVTFYEGAEAMKQAVMDTLYCRDRHIDSLAPSDNFFWQVGQAFSQPYIDQRVARKITTRHLWEEPLEPEIMLRTYRGLSQVRLLPATMRGRFRTTVFLYDDAVMYISSLASGYALVVRSPEHHELMKGMFDALWEGAAPVKTP